MGDASDRDRLRAATPRTARGPATRVSFPSERAVRAAFDAWRRTHERLTERAARNRPAGP
jgi:hypothetical protein